jgi:ribosomal protein RSM22 (predicted rRNA methylase)
MLEVFGYPEWLENWWIQEACQRSSVSHLNELLPDLEKEIQKLSDRFTISCAESFSDVYEHPKLLLAYGLFYFPQTFVRMQFPIAELFLCKWNPSTNKTFRILDIGSGTGAAAISSATLLRQKGVGRLDITCMDRSESSLILLQRITRDLKEQLPEIHWDTVRIDGSSLESISGAFDLVLMSFALGELFVNRSVEAVYEWIKQLSSKLTTNGMLIITEPALRETSVQLEKLRDLVSVHSSMHIWGPCLHQERCPLLEEGKFWCHEVRKWNVPESLHYLNRHLYRSIHLLKFSFLTLGKQRAEQYPKEYFRLISPMTKMKGKYVGVGCAADGKMREYQILKRDLDESTVDFLKECERGDIMKL